MNYQDLIRINSREKLIKRTKFWTQIKSLKTNKYFLCIGVAMGSQLMNSVLYITNYMNELYCDKELDNNMIIKINDH